MKNLKLKLRQFFYRIKHDYLSFDNILLAVAIGACILWTYSAIIAMSRNWELAQKISEKKRELAVLELEVETLELENEYYASEEYQELAARRQQNKKLPGENLVYLPANSEAAKTKHANDSVIATTQKSNMSQWLSLLFGI